MTTEAGKRLLAENWDNFDAEPWGSMADHVDAIETEAREQGTALGYRDGLVIGRRDGRADLARRIEARMETLPRAYVQPHPASNAGTLMVDRAAVLAAIREEASR